MLIGLWQFAHFPRRQHQLTIGMFWYQRIGAWQFGQCEGGNAMFSPRGIRQMQTLRKLAMQAPIAKAKQPKTRK